MLHRPIRTAILAATLIAALLLTDPAGAAVVQPACLPPDEPAPGLWAGSFTVRAERERIETDDAGRPATWRGGSRLVGSLALAVPEPAEAADAALTGRAWADWRVQTTMLDADENGRALEYRGWLSGGTLTLAGAWPPALGAQLVWSGAWWTAPPGSSLGVAVQRLEAGMPVGPHGDGPLRPRPAGALAFTVASVTCAEISGSVDVFQFWYPGAEPDPETRTITASGRFSLVPEFPAGGP